MDKTAYMLIFMGVLFWIFKVKNSPVLSFIFSIGAYLFCDFYLGENSFLLFDLPGGISIYPMDVVSGVLVLGILLRAKHLSKKIVIFKPVRRYMIFSIIIFCVIAYSAYIRGQVAMNNSRMFFASITAGLYFISFDYDRRTLNKLFFSYCAIICVLMLATLFRVLGIDWKAVFWAWTSDRVIASSCALAIAVFFIINLWILANLKMKLIYFVSAIASCYLVIIMQHRSVWLGALSGIFFCGFFSKRKIIFVLLGIFLLIGFFFTSYFFPYIADHYKESISGSTIKSTDEFETSTGKFRVNRWAGHFQENMDIKTLLIGNGFGWKQDKYERGSMMFTSMHNYYLEILFAVGIFPLVLFILMNVYLFMAMSRETTVLTNLFANVAVTYLVFAFAYPLSLDYFAFLGIATSVILQKDKETLFATG